MNVLVQATRAYTASRVGRLGVRAATRGFATTQNRAQAEQVPMKKPVNNKEFKIYRWVSAVVLLDPSFLVEMQQSAEKRFAGLSFVF